MPLEPLVAFLGGIVLIITSFVTPKIEPSAPDEQIRQMMLTRVKNGWVEGVLEKSLDKEARIELGLEERRAAVDERPWDMILQTPDQPDCVLRPETKIVDIFEKVGRSLLILGEPGAGKTTTLLELARDTIDHAEKDPDEPIPVVFNLSSWTNPKQTIEDWLVDGISSMYSFSKDTATGWIEENSLLLLLDGLDEVAPERRAACVDAINDFLQEHSVPVVVCSRKDEYEALDTRLKLQSAVSLQPLTPEQIDDHLQKLGSGMDALREMLQSDQAFMEFAQTPLILSIMTLAYREMPVESLQSFDSIEDRRRHLFRTYVDQMFKRTTRIDPQLYPKEKTLRWLSWLARKMSEHSQTVFLIERMQPSWLETKAQNRLYSIISVLTVGLIGGLIFGLIFGLIGGLTGQVGGLTYGLIVGLIVGLIGGLIFGLILGLIGGPIGGLGGGLGGKGLRWIEPIEVLNWSWKRGRNGLIFGLIGGLIVGLIFGLIGVLGVGLSVGLIGVLIGGLSGGLSGAEMETRTIPNQGIRQSTKNAVVVGLIFGSIGGLTGLVGGLIGGLSSGLIGGLIFGLIVGLIGGLSFGGMAVIQHFVLRFLTYQKGYLPWKLVSFLDYAAERIFLRKVGGGYVFVHRMLMDYFATLETEQEGR